MVVTTYLSISWIKPYKWHLVGKRGSLRFYLMGFDLDSTPLGSRIEGKSEGFLRALSIQLAALLRNFIVCRKNCLVIHGWLASI